ncbi:hypothetical protein [Indibacter alkaliphilus]|nr:hypothetical protein [Indibacter alkaliphilus]
MKKQTINVSKLIMLLVMMVVLSAACTGPEEDFTPIDRTPPAQTEVTEETAVDEEETDEVVPDLPVRTFFEMDGHDFSVERNKTYRLRGYTQQSGDRLEVVLVRMERGEEVMYKIPGRGYNDESSYNVFWLLPGGGEPDAGFEISVSGGQGEKYDKVIVMVRN